MTETLYDYAPYETEFDAYVIACYEKKEFYEIVLDRTLFFPEEGGQTPDIGELMISAGSSSDQETDEAFMISVTDVQIRDGVIYHKTNQAIPAGTHVHGRINWQHRYDNMKQHTGEHIFSGLVNSRYGYDNVGFHLSDHEVTMDYNGILTDKDVQELETEANRLIQANCVVGVCFVDQNGHKLSIPTEMDTKQGESSKNFIHELQETDILQYRSKKELSGPIRIVMIKELVSDGSWNTIDVCACCAPHVRYTGEIGILKVISRQNYKKGVRLSIACGERAIKLFQEEHIMLQGLAGEFTTAVCNIPDRIKRLKEESGALKASLSQARRDILIMKTREISPDQETVILFETGSDADTMRHTAEMICRERGGTCAIFLKAAGDAYNYYIATSEEKTGPLQQILREHLQAKGGGSGTLLQGRISGATEDMIRETMQNLNNSRH